MEAGLWHQHLEGMYSTRLLCYAATLQIHSNKIFEHWFMFADKNKKIKNILWSRDFRKIQEVMNINTRLYLFKTIQNAVL